MGMKIMLLSNLSKPWRPYFLVNIRLTKNKILKTRYQKLDAKNKILKIGYQKLGANNKILEIWSLK